jgi:pimeloyl-ACP methyl ester carboxylesterase
MNVCFDFRFGDADACRRPVRGSATPSEAFLSDTQPSAFRHASVDPKRRSTSVALRHRGNHPTGVAARRFFVMTRDGVRLAVCDGGPPRAGHTVVFLHGFCLTGASWSHQIDYLLRRYGEHIRVISYDHRGHGRSSGAPMSTYRIEQLACDLADVLVALEVSGSVTFVGHSMGGMVALTYLGRPPRTGLSTRMHWSWSPPRPAGSPSAVWAGCWQPRPPRRWCGLPTTPPSRRCGFWPGPCARRWAAGMATGARSARRWCRLRQRR